MQTGSYKEAAIGIKMAIIHRRHPEVKLYQEQTDVIQEKLLTAVYAKPAEESPVQLLYSKFAQGIFWITCANESTKEWLMRTISGPGNLWEGAELTVVVSKDFPKRPRVLVRISDTSEITTVLTRLKKQNPVFNTSDWIDMSRKVIEKEQTLAFSIDPESHRALANSNFKAFWDWEESPSGP
jgi:hypothetical protein